MKEWVPAIWDDIHLHEAERRTPAAITRYIGLDGRWFELDLDAGHDQELVNFLRRYLDAGRKPEKTPTPQRVAQTGLKHDPDSLESKKKLRKWTKDNRVMRKDGSGLLAYQTTTGRYYYPDWLWKQYQEAHADGG